MDFLFMGVGRLREAAQKDRHSSDVLASPSKLWGISPSIQDVMLDLADATLSAACRVMRMWHSVLR